MIYGSLKFKSPTFIFDREFGVSSRYHDYSLKISGYSGTAGDGLDTRWHKDKKISAKDHDVDTSSGSCAQQYKGGWWYGGCHSVNLNGLYHRGSYDSYADGVNWSPWKGHHYSLKFVEMKIRPTGY